MDAVKIERLVLLTDFGPGIYVGQMQARLDALLPGLARIDLAHDLAPFRPDLAGYLLRALIRDMPECSLYLCVVDPGVGGERSLLLARVGRDWLVAPDNGLLAPLLRRAEDWALWRIGWCPERSSASFHGRDWIAPAAARLALGEDLRLTPLAFGQWVGADWPRELRVILHVDHFGNLLTGLDAPSPDADYALQVGSHRLPRARTFCEVAPGSAFWYENALGLIEIAVSQGRADRLLGLGVGDPVEPILA